MSGIAYSHYTSISPSSAAPPPPRCIPSSAHCSSSRFQHFWQRSITGRKEPCIRPKGGRTFYPSTKLYYTDTIFSGSCFLGAPSLCLSLSPPILPFYVSPARSSQITQHTKSPVPRVQMMFSVKQGSDAHPLHSVAKDEGEGK